ncbi:DUF788-domain-containing protein [Violaceomyces palustris]|uniref:DUF788-domain-containing protein n=1 Tax=Violaceomyces palustris TaxID=1673888 RepID=A0ACD0NN76_9BASI|nr:DUF788-domain-containing protein [Violaceomyces palustris]
MAKGSSKKISSNNQSTLQVLQYGFLITNTIHLVFRFWFFKSSATWRSLLAYLSTEALALFLWIQLISMAKGGDDLAQPGLTAYMFDVIYVTWFVHITTALFSHYFWWIYLCIPAYACYMLYQKVLLPFLFKGRSPFESIGRMFSGGGSGGTGVGGKNGDQQEATPALSKRQAKLQARAEKGDPRVQVRRR